MRSFIRTTSLFISGSRNPGKECICIFCYARDANYNYNYNYNNNFNYNFNYNFNINRATLRFAKSKLTGGAFRKSMIS